MEYELYLWARTPSIFGALRIRQMNNDHNFVINIDWISVVAIWCFLRFYCLRLNVACAVCAWLFHESNSVRLGKESYAFGTRYGGWPFSKDPHFPFIYALTLKHLRTSVVCMLWQWCSHIICVSQMERRQFLSYTQCCRQPNWIVIRQ